MRRAARRPRLVLGGVDDELLGLLRYLEDAVLRHPRAAQAAWRALVAEGRRFADTDEGRRWLARLEGSELVRRGDMLRAGTALDMLEEDGDAVLPSDLVDGVLSALARPDLQALLLRLRNPDADRA